MDDIDLNLYNSKRVDRERAPGPFGHREERLPDGVMKWKNRVHPKTKERTKLLDFNCERDPTLRILESLQNYTFEWTKKVVKTRNSLDASVDTDRAPTMFRLDPFGQLADRGQQLRDTRNDHRDDGDFQDDSANARQKTMIQAWINNPAVFDVDEFDESTLELHCIMIPGDAAIYKELVRVYDAALCHFLYDCVSKELARFLNAERIKSLNADEPRVFNWAAHRSKLLNQTKNTAESDDLLSFFLKCRDESL